MSGMCPSLRLSSSWANMWRNAQVRAEIEALHGRKAEAMRAAMQAQRRELEDICAASHMAVPPLPPAPSSEAGLPGAALCGQVGAHLSQPLLCCSHPREVPPTNHISRLAGGPVQSVVMADQHSPPHDS